MTARRALQAPAQPALLTRNTLMMWYRRVSTSDATVVVAAIACCVRVLFLLAAERSGVLSWQESSMLQGVASK